MPGNASKLVHTYMRGEHQFDGWDQSGASSVYDRYEIVLYRSGEGSDLLVLTRHPLPLLEGFREDYLLTDALRIRPSSADQAILTTCRQATAPRLAVFALVNDPSGEPTAIAAWRVALESGGIDRVTDTAAVACLADPGEGE